MGHSGKRMLKMFIQDWSLHQLGSTAVQTPNGTAINDCDNNT